MNSNSGSTLILTLAVLVFLSIIGFSALQMSDIELRSARVTRDFKRSFYIADGGINREAVECLDYPVYPTPEEQRSMQPYRLAIASNGTYSDCPYDGNCASTNATRGADHYVANNLYDYAVDFRRRMQPVSIKGESVDVIYYRLYTRDSNSFVRAEGYYRSTTGM